MTPAIHRSPGRLGPNGLAAVMLGAILLTVHPSDAQQGEHWVGTWMAASVARPQAPPPPAAPAALPPAQTQQAPAAPPAPAPFMHFNNQTLRQIVHTSIGGRRVRVVLSNVFGTSPLTIGAAHIALARQGPGHRAGV